jgi:hypothetical protein
MKALLASVDCLSCLRLPLPDPFRTMRLGRQSSKILSLPIRGHVHVPTTLPAMVVRAGNAAPTAAQALLTDLLR